MSLRTIHSSTAVANAGRLQHVLAAGLAHHGHRSAPTGAPEEEEGDDDGIYSFADLQRLVELMDEMEAARANSPEERAMAALLADMIKLSATFDEGTVTQILAAFEEFRMRHYVPSRNRRRLRHKLETRHFQRSLLVAAVASPALRVGDEANQLAIARQLLLFGAPASAGEPSPMAYAVMYQRPQLVDLLKLNGARATVPTGFADRPDGETIVEYARSRLRAIVRESGVGTPAWRDASAIYGALRYQN